MEELAKYLKALLLLDLWRSQMEAQRNGSSATKLELLLADSGFSNKEVSDLLGKSVAAVAKAISRGRATRKAGAREDQSNGGGAGAE